MRFPLIAIALVVPGLALAQDEGTLARARDYVGTANGLFARGQYGIACTTFREAYELIPDNPVSINILFNMAVSCRRQYTLDGDVSWLRRSFEYYTRYLATVQEGGRRDEVLRAVEEIRKILQARPPEPEAPPVTQLLVTSRTPGASARVDGGPPADVPYPATVTPGQHTVVVEAPGFVATRSVTIALKGRLVVVPMDLEAIPARIFVRAPAESHVFVDGVHVGESPLRGPASLDAGEHIVTVTQPGHRPAVKRFEVGRGGALDLRIPELEPTNQRVASRFLLGGAIGAALAGGVASIVAVVKEQQAVSASTETHPSPGNTRADIEGFNADLRARNDFRTGAIALLCSAGVLAVTGVMLYVLDAPEVPAPPVTVRASAVSAPGEIPGMGGR